MGISSPKRPRAKVATRSFMAFALAATLAFPFAGIAVADESVSEAPSVPEPAGAPSLDSGVANLYAEAPAAPDSSESVIAAAADSDLRAADQGPFLVNRLEDDADEGSLRWAINAANAVADKSANVKIEMDSSLAAGVIEIHSELPTIERSMTVEGPIGGVTVRKGKNALINDSWRHIRIEPLNEQVDPEFNVTLSNLTFEGPGAQHSSQQLENGGIYVDEGFMGELALYDCALKSNVNDNGSDLEAPNPESNGGAINVQSEGATLRMTRCAIENNTAEWFGGGVYSIAMVIAEDCAFKDNQSTVGGGGGLLATEKASLANCRFEDNRAGGDSGGVQSQELTMTTCIVDNNTAGMDTVEYSTGGGVGAVDLTMTSCQVTNNSAGSGGGVYCSGVVDVADSTVSENTAYRWGGGLFVVLGGSVRNSSLENNSASSVGGAIAVGDESAARETALAVADSTIARNKASEGGGGVFMYDMCALAFDNVVLSENQADGAGGGVCGELGASLVAKGSQIVGNKAKDDGSPASGFGGGVYLEEGDVAMERCDVSGNAAEGNGGGVFALNATVGDSKLIGNRAGGSGGALCAYKLEMSGSQISGNEAKDTGGGLQAELAIVGGSTLDGNSAHSGAGLRATQAGLVNCTLAGNQAAWVGGGLNAHEAVLANCTVSGNVARASEGSGSLGGGLQTEVLEMNGCLVAGNYDSDGIPSEVRLGEKTDNGAGVVSNAYGKSNLVGIPAAGLRTVMVTETVSGLEVGSLADNGGTTQTIMITPDGPAQDAVPAGAYAVPSVDQRGDARPFGAAADIGAVEISGLSRVYEVLRQFAIYRGGDDPLAATIDAPARSVMSVALDGGTLEAGTQYIVSEGSTVVSLQPSYLKTLGDGTYRVVVTYTNGQAALPLTVDVANPQPVNPDDPKPVSPSDDPKKKPTALVRTGDTVGAVGGLVLLAASIAVVSLGIARRRLS